MAVYSVSFRIHSDATYSDRYSSFMGVAKTPKYWAETTSFLIVETSEDIDVYCQRIYLTSQFDASKDLFLVLDANSKIGRVKGAWRDADLFKLIPYVVAI